MVRDVKRMRRTVSGNVKAESVSQFPNSCDYHEGVSLPVITHDDMNNGYISIICSGVFFRQFVEFLGFMRSQLNSKFSFCFRHVRLRHETDYLNYCKSTASVNLGHASIISTCHMTQRVWDILRSLIKAQREQ